MDYTEQITYLLFLKMTSERSVRKGDLDIPTRYSWNVLTRIESDVALALRYHQAIRKLSEQPGLLGLIFTKPQSKINDPAKLRLLIEMIGNVNWSALDVDVKGDIYEGLLARNAEDVRGGAGQYFTPRPVIRAIVSVMRPEPLMRVADPACGTGGFILAAYEHMKRRVKDPKEDHFLHAQALRGSDLVPNVARLCAMNLFLHGIGAAGGATPISIGDSLARKSEAVDMVLTNPPFGKKSSITIIGDDGRKQTDRIHYRRDDFWASTSNKQLNFVQHVYSMLRKDGRAAVVVPDNVLFEAGAGEKIRRNMLKHCDVHTLLRLPTGIWYSPGVQANVLFFDKQPPRKRPGQMWIYDLRTNKNFTLRNNPITTNDLDDFVSSYAPEDRTKRGETHRFKCFSYDELLCRDKANWDIFWLKDASRTDADSLPSPRRLSKAIMADLEAAMEEFGAVDDILGSNE